MLRRTLTLNDWLRSKGVKQKKAIHSLRKESGSLIASAYGIEAARQNLGHRDIRTTSSHYVDKKKRMEVKLPICESTRQLTRPIFLKLDGGALQRQTYMYLKENCEKKPVGLAGRLSVKVAFLQTGWRLSEKVNE